MLRIVLCGCLATAVLGLSEARAQSPAVADLKKEINELRAEVTLLKRDVEILKLQVGSPKSRPTNLAVRLTAIDSIIEYSAKQAAYSKLAIDAAAQGDIKIADSMLTKLNDYAARQDTTYKVAVILGAAGHEAEALKLASSINDHALRQKLLAKIAMGDPTP